MIGAEVGITSPRYKGKVPANYFIKFNIIPQLKLMIKRNMEFIKKGSTRDFSRRADIFDGTAYVEKTKNLKPGTFVTLTVSTDGCNMNTSTKNTLWPSSDLKNISNQRELLKVNDTKADIF